MLRRSGSLFKISKALFSQDHHIFGKKIVIFGSYGHFGRYLVEAVANSFGICILPVRADIDDMRHLKVLGNPGYICPIPFHPRDDDSIRECISGAHIVINLMGKYYQTRHLAWNTIVSSFEWTNIELPRKLAVLCREMGVPYFIHMSALQQSVSHESNWCATKALGEIAVRQEFPGAIIVRPADMFSRYSRFVNLIGTLCRWHPRLVEFSYSARKQPVWSGDVSDGIKKIMKNIDFYEGKTFEFAGPEIISMKDIWGWAGNYLFRPMDKYKQRSFSYVKFVAGNWDLYMKPLFCSEDLPRLKYDNFIKPDSKAITLTELGIKPITMDSKIIMLKKWTCKWRKRKYRINEIHRESPLDPFKSYIGHKISEH